MRELNKIITFGPEKAWKMKRVKTAVLEVINRHRRCQVMGQVPLGSIKHAALFVKKAATEPSMVMGAGTSEHPPHILTPTDAR